MGDGRRDGLVDAGDLLALTDRLRAARASIEEAAVSPDQRARWQRTLASIAEGATRDIGRAAEQLHRLEAQVERAAR